MLNFQSNTLPQNIPHISLPRPAHSTQTDRITVIPAPGTFSLCVSCKKLLTKGQVYAVVGDGFECVDCLPYEEDSSLDCDFHAAKEAALMPGYEW